MRKRQIALVLAIGVAFGIAITAMFPKSKKGTEIDDTASKEQQTMIGEMRKEMASMTTKMQRLKIEKETMAQETAANSVLLAATNAIKESTEVDAAVSSLRTVPPPPPPPPSSPPPPSQPEAQPPPIDSKKYSVVSARASSGIMFKMAVHKGPPADVISSAIMYQSSWEPEVCETLTSMFKEADAIGKPSKGTNVFLDVGANIGFHTLCVAAGNR